MEVNVSDKESEEETVAQTGAKQRERESKGDVFVCLRGVTLSEKRKTTTEGEEETEREVWRL